MRRALATDKRSVVFERNDTGQTTKVIRWSFERHTQCQSDLMHPSFDFL